MASLTFYFDGPNDLLGKLRRDHARLRDAVSAKSKQAIADCLFDFANTAYCIKDWLKRNAAGRFSVQEVEKYMETNPVLNACRDICNANKHYTLRYAPVIKDVYASVTATAEAEMAFERSGVALEEDEAPFRVKVLMADGSKYEVLEFGEAVVTLWAGFISQTDV